MSRRRALWVIGAAMVALGIVLLVLDARMRRAGGPGIVGFELAGSEGRAREILAEWGSDGRAAARLSLWLDYAYLAAYGAFFALAVAAVRDMARRRGWRRLAAIGTPVVVFPIVAAALDAVENVGLLLALGGHGGAVAPLVATIFASGKFVLSGATLVYVVCGLGLRLHAGLARARPA